MMDAFDATVEIVKSLVQSNDKWYPNKQEGVDIADCFEAIYTKLKTIADSDIPKARPIGSSGPKIPGAF